MIININTVLYLLLFNDIKSSVTKYVNFINNWMKMLEKCIQRIQYFTIFGKNMKFSLDISYCFWNDLFAPKCLKCALHRFNTFKIFLHIQESDKKVAERIIGFASMSYVLTLLLGTLTSHHLPSIIWRWARHLNCDS